MQWEGPTTAPTDAGRGPLLRWSRVLVARLAKLVQHEGSLPPKGAGGEVGGGLEIGATYFRKCGPGVGGGGPLSQGPPCL